MAGKFAVLFTHQKTKKAKSWRDGILIVSSDGKTAELTDEEGKRLDRVKLTAELKVGDEIESARYLIQVDDVQDFESKATSLPAKEDSQTRKSAVSVPSNSLKFKKIGFKNPGIDITGTFQKPVPYSHNDVSNSESAAKTFTILYTHQKLKKHKMWQDGSLVISKKGKSASVMDENGKKIDEISLRSSVAVGDELESAKFLIQIDSIVNSCKSETENQKIKPALEVFGSLLAVFNETQCSQKRDGSVLCQPVERNRVKRKKFSAPRRTGPPVQSTFSSVETNPDDEFGGIACTVVRQNADGIWGTTHYNQELASPQMQNSNHRQIQEKNLVSLPPKSRNQKLQSREDILNFIQSTKKKFDNNFPKATTKEIQNKNVVNYYEQAVAIETRKVCDSRLHLDSEDENIFLSVRETDRNKVGADFNKENDEDCSEHMVAPTSGLSYSDDDSFSGDESLFHSSGPRRKMITQNFSEELSSDEFELSPAFSLT